MSGASAKNEPRMNADERRFVMLGLRQWRHSEGKGLGSGSGRAQVGLLGGMIF